MREINTAVVDDYDRYLRIQSDVKHLTSDQICLHRDERRSNQQSADSKVVFDKGQELARLNVSLNSDRLKSFKFRLFCDDFMPEPCYRFDSDGPVHRNPEQPGVTLVNRQIPTPHFHKFDEKGHEIAYKTERLISDEKKLLSNYESAMKHFCEEENVALSPGTAVLTDEFLFGTKEFADPLEGVEFP